MDEDTFYLVLPSNSSMKYFPDNATSCFTTHLSHEIRLHGDWSVGLTEIHIPSTILHIQEFEANFFFYTDVMEPPPPQLFSLENTKVLECSFPSGVYESVAELARAINNHAGEINKHIVFDAAKKRKGFYVVHRVCDCKETHYIRMNEKLRRVFGFENEIHRKSEIITLKARKNNDSAKGVSIIGDRPACLARAIPDQFYIYTDICVPYTLGDTQASLLRIVTFNNTKYAFGSNIVKQFSPVNYIPLLNNTFQNIILDIRDQHGYRIPFEYGTLTVTLHFKRNH